MNNERIFTQSEAEKERIECLHDNVVEASFSCMKSFMGKCVQGNEREMMTGHERSQRKKQESVRT